jgi:hypothetical protein
LRRRRQLRVLRRLRADAHRDADRNPVPDTDAHVVDERVHDTRDAFTDPDVDAVRPSALAQPDPPQATVATTAMEPDGT